MPISYSPAVRVLDADPPIPDGPPSTIPAWKSMLDAKLYTRFALAGHLEWEGSLSAYGTAASPIVEVGPITAVTLYDSVTAGWYTFSAGVATLGNTHSGGTLSLDTWYYVYVYVTTPGLTLGYEISSTPPHAPGNYGRRGRYKNGQTANYLYLGCFRNATNPLPTVRAAGGVYTYALGLTTFSATSLGVFTGGTYAATNQLAKYLPPHARTVDIIAEAEGLGVSQGTVTVQPASGGVGEYRLEVGPTGYPDATTTWRIPIHLTTTPTAANHDLQVKCASGGSLPQATLYTQGWVD